MCACILFGLHRLTHSLTVTIQLTVKIGKTEKPKQLFENSPNPLPTYAHTCVLSQAQNPPRDPLLCTQIKGFKLLDSGLVYANPTCHSLFINSTHLFRIGPKQVSMSSQWSLQQQSSGERNLLIGWGRMKDPPAHKGMLDHHMGMKHRGQGWIQLPLLPR